MFIDLSLRSLEDMLVCKEKSQHLMQKNNEALLQYVEEIKNLRNLILNDIQDASNSQPIQNPGGNLSNNRENILRKDLKCKQLEDDNKKLRKLLKTQIENSEQLRQDTQNTIETLREEFDILVKELLQYKQKDDKKGAKPNTKFVPQNKGGGMKSGQKQQ